MSVLPFKLAPVTLEEVRPMAIKESFSVPAMTRLLDGEHAALRHQVRGILSQPMFTYYAGTDKDEYREVVLKWGQEFSKDGLGALSFPKAIRHASRGASGGQEDYGQYMAMFETMGFHDLSLLIKFGVQIGLFGGSIALLGTESHHERYLRDVATFALLGCFAMTELGHGSNVRGLETTAHYDRQTQEFIIHTPSESARKEYIGNAAAHGQLATVFAQLEIDGKAHGVHAFLVPIRNAAGYAMRGVRIEDCGEKLGLNGVDNGRLWFDGVRIPRENLLNRFADVSPEGVYSSPIANPSRRFFTMIGTLVGGRMGVGAAALSAAKSGLTIAIKYGASRRQFGPDEQAETVILDYRTHQRRLMPLLANAYALDFAFKYMTRRYLEQYGNPDGDSREVETLAAALKAFSTWNTTHTLQTCREACGGQGYLAVNRFAALKADTDIFTTFEGDNTVLMQLVAKGVLTEFNDQFNDFDLFSGAKYLAKQASRAISELNPIITRLSTSEHLRDSDFHLNAFRYREQHLLTTVAQRLNKRIKRGMAPHDALIRVQDHMLALGHAYAERVILEQFVAGVEQCDDPALKRTLKRLCDLFALSQIEKNKGWYLEHGYLEGIKSKAIRRQVNKLCWEVRKEALPLVEAFAIPDECLAAPIAL